MKTIVISIICCALLSGSMFSQNITSLNEAAVHAVDPAARINKLQFQPNYYIYFGGGNQFNLTSRIIHSFNGIYFPFIKSRNPKKLYSVVRVEVPVTSQTYGLNSPLNATGLSDITCLDVLVNKTRWGSFGGGASFSFPTATCPALGSGKWMIGFSGIIMSSVIKGWMLGLLFQQYFSVAGTPSKPPKNYMLIQPMINYFIGKGYFLGYTSIITLDWEADAYTLPLSLGFGKAFARNFTLMLTPEYFLTGPMKKSFLIQLNINAMF